MKLSDPAAQVRLKIWVLCLVLETRPPPHAIMKDRPKFTVLCATWTDFPIDDIPCEFLTPVSKHDLDFFGVGLETFLIGDSNNQAF